MGTVRSWRCLGMTTIRSPGVCIAIETGSCCCCCLLPQAARPAAAAAMLIVATARVVHRLPVVMLPLLWTPTAASIGFLGGYPRPCPGNGLRRGGREAVGLSELGVLAGQHLGEVDHHAALLPGRVVLHLAVDHVHAAAVGDRLDDLLGEDDLVGGRREDLLGDAELDGVQRPGADAAQQERGAE